MREKVTAAVFLIFALGFALVVASPLLLCLYIALTA